jgi:hypothetical protein
MTDREHPQGVSMARNELRRAYDRNEVSPEEYRARSAELDRLAGYTTAADAEARQRGENFDGTPRRETTAGAAMMTTGAGDPPPLLFVYRNHRGEMGLRRVIPISVRHGTNEWYKDPQWLLRARDLDRGAEREFALGNIWRVCQPASLRPLGPSALVIQSEIDKMEAANLHELPKSELERGKALYDLRAVMQSDGSWWAR